jgi:Arc/MetJ-type ribon-helix-helix transcriptional regulator
MSVVHIPDELRQVIDRQVAEGRAASAVEFLEAAVRRYALELEANDVAMIAAANEGIEAIRRGECVTISSSKDQEAFHQRVWSRAMALADETKAHEQPASDEQAATRTIG